MKTLDVPDKVYISGPMTGISPIEYRRRFNLAEQLLRSEGYRYIVNPVRVWACRFPWLYKIIGYRLTLFYDLWLLTRCNRIYKMPGWRESRGAQIESCVAFHFGVFTIAQSIRKRIDASFIKTELKL